MPSMCLFLLLILSLRVNCSDHHLDPFKSADRLQSLWEHY